MHSSTGSKKMGYQQNSKEIFFPKTSTYHYVVTGDRELGFDSGEGAWEMATISKEDSRHENYPIPTWGGSDKK